MDRNETVAGEAAVGSGWGRHIRRVVTGWPGVTTAPEQFGGVDYVVDGRSLGHVHGDELADIEFPRALRDELVAAGRTGPHHRDPDSAWTTLVIRSEADADTVVELLRLNYDRIVAGPPGARGA